jgi:hypothetical protein
MNLLNLIEDSNTGYDNLRALMQAVQNSQDALLTIGGEPVTLTYPEARFIYGKYKAYLKAGRQEEFISDLGDPRRFDMHMKQLRQLLDKQKNFRGSVPGERGVAGDVPQGMEEGLFGGTAKTAPGQLKTYAVYDGFTIYYDPAKEMFVTAGTGEYKDKFRARGFPAHSAQGGVGTAEFYGQQMTGGQRKQPISMDRSVTGGAHESVAEAEPVPGKYSGHFYDAEILPNGDYKVVKINSKSDQETGQTNPLNLQVGAVVPKDKAHALQYNHDGGMFDQLKNVPEQAVEEIAMPNPNRPTAQTAGKINWERMIKDYMENKPYSEFEFAGDRPLTLYRSQVYAILKDFGRMKPQQKVGIILNTFGDKIAMVDYIDKLRAKGMMPKKVPAYVSPDVEPVPPGQMSFPGMGTPRIKEAEAQKKNSEQTSLDGNTARSPKVQRAFQLARARQSAAGSDIEAFVKDELEKSEQAQAQLDQLQAENDRQDQQIQQLAAKVRQQDQEISQPEPTAVKTEPAKEKPKAAEPEKKAEPGKKATEPRAAEKPAEPKQQRDEPRAEPADAEKPPKVDQPKPDNTEIQRPRPDPVDFPDNVLQFPSNGRRRRKGNRRQSDAAASMDPLAAATLGVDMPRAVGMNESNDELHIGDPVIIRGNVEHSGKTGDVAEFGRDKHFVIVDLYNFGKHAFHASNVEYNEYADQEDYIDENQRMDKFTIAQPTPGGTNKQREEFLDARDRLFRQMTNASSGEKEVIRLKIADLEGRAQSQGIRIRETEDLNRSGYNAIKTVGDWAEKMRVMRELQKDIALMSDPEAKAAVQQRIGDLLKVGIKQGYVKEALNDKAMSVLRSLQQPAQTAPVDIDLNVPEPVSEPAMDLASVRKRIAQLDELIRMKEQIDKLFVRAQNARGGIYPGLQSDIEDEELYGVPQSDKEYQTLKHKYTKDLLALQKFIAMKKAVYREGQEIVGESSALVRLKRARQALSQPSQVNEFSSTGSDDGGEDPYGRPQPRHYNRSVDYFSQFEADHFDREDFDDATGVFKGYWGDDQIAYFKFDNPQRNGSDDPGMGWYYEPQNESVEESLADEFMKMAKDMGMNPRLRGTPDEERARTDAMLKKRAADRANAPKPASVSDEERAGLEARLKDLEARFDPDFEYSDDYSFWSKQNDIKKNINSIKQRLSQGMAEAQTDYQRRRQRERDVDAGKPVSRQPKNPQTDYARMRAKQKRDQELGEKKDRSPGKITKSEDPCWTGYHMVGKKKKNGREVPNCVPGKKG